MCHFCFLSSPNISIFKTLKPTQHLFGQLFKSLNCSPILEVVISLALTYSKNSDFVRLAENQLKICLSSLIQSYVELGKQCCSIIMPIRFRICICIHLFILIFRFSLNIFRYCPFESRRKS